MKARSPEREIAFARARRWRAARDAAGLKTTDVALRARMALTRCLAVLCAREEPTASEVAAIDLALSRKEVLKHNM